MSYFLRCATDVTPCPAADQEALTGAALADFASIGFTSTSAAEAIGFGFAVVFFFAMLGMGAGWAIRLIRAL